MKHCAAGAPLAALAIAWSLSSASACRTLSVRQAEDPSPAHAVVSLHEFTYTEVHMGVPVRLVLYAGSDSEAQTAARAAFERIAALDHTMSDYRPDSELSKLNHTSGAWVPVSAELFTVLARARTIAEQTGGAFDPTMGPVVALWREARRSGRLPDAGALAEARARAGWHALTLDAARQAVRLDRPGMRLDLGGIAKGFILQAALDLLRARGTTRVLIQAGGDLVVGEAPPGRSGWRIAAPGASATFRDQAASLVNAALATSGPTFQYLEVDGTRYSHVVDPRTGLGLTSSRVVYVIAGDGATADAFATVVGVTGTCAWDAVSGCSLATPDAAGIRDGHQYRGTAGSMSTDHASMPPARL